MPLIGALCVIERPMKVLIDWSAIHSQESFYDCVLNQLAAPEWHGRNLNAFADSIVTGDINKIEPPYTIISENGNCVESELAWFYHEVIAIFHEAINEGREIEFLVSSNNRNYYAASKSACCPKNISFGDLKFRVARGRSFKRSITNWTSLSLTILKSVSLGKY